MSNYSIKDLERLTNVKAHTLRIWEKRYQIVDPERSDSNIRSYSDEDLKKLLNISILNRHGYKISNIIKMGMSEIAEKVNSIISHESEYHGQIKSLVVAMIELNENKFDEILNQSIRKIGFEESVYNLIYPFYEKVGLLWQTGVICPAQEHFISHLIRTKLIVAIDSLPKTSKPGSKKIMLFLPDWEMHENGLLMYAYLARKKGLKVFYLGQSIPLQDVFTTAEIVQPDIMITYFVSNISGHEIEKYIQRLTSQLPAIPIYISGAQLNNIDFVLPEKVQTVRSSIEFGLRIAAL